MFYQGYSRYDSKKNGGLTLKKYDILKGIGKNGILTLVADKKETEM